MREGSTLAVEAAGMRAFFFFSFFPIFLHCIVQDGGWNAKGKSTLVLRQTEIQTDRQTDCLTDRPTD
jgi:hypothetical protein